MTRVGEFILTALGILMGLWLVFDQLIGVGVSGPRAVLDAMLIIMGTQFLLFAMMFDMQESLDLAPLDRRSLDRAGTRGNERKSN